MQLQAVNNQIYSIQKYTNDEVQINNQVYTKSIIIFNQIEELSVNQAEQLTMQDLQSLLNNQPQLVIIGTGKQQKFLSPSIYNQFIKQSIGVEFMNNDAACRTYNLLLSENRKVALVLILD